MKTFAVVLILGCVALSFAGDCNNPQLAALVADDKITKLDTPITVAKADITYCKEILGDKEMGSCCSAETINKVQTMQDTMKNKFQDVAAKRDKKMKKIAEKVAPLLQSAADNVTTIAEKMPEGLKANLTARVAPLKEFMSQVKDKLPTIKSDFQSFQSSRATCFKTMMDLQGSALCLACDASYATQGVDGSSGNITMSDATCTRIMEACYDFVTNSAKQGQMQGVQKAVGMLQGYAAMGADMSGQARPGQVKPGETLGSTQPPPPPPSGTGSLPPLPSGDGSMMPSGDGSMMPPPPSDFTGSLPSIDFSSFDPAMLGASSTSTVDMTQLKALAQSDPASMLQNGIVPVQNFDKQPKESDGLPKVESGFQPADDTDRPPKVPQDCVSKTDCKWLCKNAFMKGKGNFDGLGQGGEIDRNDDGTAEPQTANDNGAPVPPPERLLASSGEWAPAEGASGTNTDVDSDPAAVSTTSTPKSATNLLFKAFSCLVLIALIMV